MVIWSYTGQISHVAQEKASAPTSSLDLSSLKRSELFEPPLSRPSEELNGRWFFPVPSGSRTAILPAIQSTTTNATFTANQFTSQHCACPVQSRRAVADALSWCTISAKSIQHVQSKPLRKPAHNDEWR